MNEGWDGVYNSWTTIAQGVPRIIFGGGNSSVVVYLRHVESLQKQDDGKTILTASSGDSFRFSDHDAVMNSITKALS